MSLQQGRRMNAANAKRRMERHYRYEEIIEEKNEKEKMKKCLKK